MPLPLSYFQNRSINPESDDFAAYLDSLGNATNATQATTAINVPQMATSQPPSQAAAPVDSDEDDSDRTPAQTAQQPVADSVKQAIAQKYGYPAGMDLDALKSAQQQQNSTNLTSDLGRAGAQIGAGIASAFGGKAETPETPVFDDMRKQSGLPVQQLLQQRDLFGKDLTMQREGAINDPNSIQSKIAQKIYGRALKEMGMGDTDLSGMSSANLEPFQKLIDAQATAEQRKLTAQMLHQQTVDRYEDKKTQKMNDNVSKSYESAKKATSKQQASIDEADGILNKIDLATHDKFAAQALPTELGLYLSAGQRLHTSTVDAMKQSDPTFLGNIKQRLQTSSSGTLLPENAANMKRLVMQIKGDEQGALDKTMKQKADFVSKNFGMDKSQVYDRFGISPEQSQRSVSEVSAHPQDAEAVAWAKANPNDPRAAKILQVNGAQ